MYSTCSIHAEEDERVVAAALKAGKGKWRLAPRSSVLPTWERRGLVEELGDQADSVIRCLPEDKTNGFFVSCFEREQEGEEKVAVGGKRQREEEAEAEEAQGVDEDAEDLDGEESAPASPAEANAKTAAQIERAKRKKQAQKKKRKTGK